MVAAPTSVRPPLTKGTIMTSSTLLHRGALAAILVAGCLAAPAAVAQPPDHGSSVKARARANVYVPPSPDTATEQGQRWLETHPAPHDLPDTHKTANVYVPPAGEQAPIAGESYAAEVGSLSDEQLAAAYGTAIPTWIPTSASTPVASDDGAGPWAVIGLALGGAALLGGARLARVRRAGRPPPTVALERGGWRRSRAAPPRRGVTGLRTRGRRCVRAARRPTPRG
jgi:hypothetical protein